MTNDQVPMINEVIATPAVLVKKSFWKRPGGVALIVVGVLVLIALLIFGSAVLFYYRRIMNGEDLSYLARAEQFTQSAALAKQTPGKTEVTLDAVVTTDDPAIGNASAPITVVEFLDFECPFSSQAFPIIREAATKNPEKIRLIIRDLPLDDVHPNARLAAEAAGCANDQKRFWAYHDKLFQNQQALDRDSLIRYAEQVGLDTATFTTCLDGRKFRAEVQEDFQAGVAAGAVGTPTFYINGRKFQGIIPEEVWAQLVQVASAASLE